MNAPDPRSIRLSPTGATRRESMRSELLGRVDRRRRRRSAMRATALIAVVAMAGFGMWRGFDRLSGPAADTDGRVELVGGDSSSEESITALAPPFGHYEHVDVEIITSDDPAPREDRYASDDELLALLHESGHAAGLIRIGNRVIVEGIDELVK